MYKRQEAFWWLWGLIGEGRAIVWDQLPGHLDDPWHPERRFRVAREGGAGVSLWESKAAGGCGLLAEGELMAAGIDLEGDLFALDAGGAATLLTADGAVRIKRITGGVPQRAAWARTTAAWSELGRPAPSGVPGSAIATGREAVALCAHADRVTAPPACLVQEQAAQEFIRQTREAAAGPLGTAAMQQRPAGTLAVAQGRAWEHMDATAYANLTSDAGEWIRQACPAATAAPAVEWRHGCPTDDLSLIHI
mgnify:CR=1 FL=1